MSQVERLLEQYVEEHRGSGDADPRAYLSRLEGPERAQLEALIDEYLRRAPRREWDAAAFAASPASEVADALARSFEGASGLWPSLLPRLRNQAQIKRSELVSELAARLGAQSNREKVARYYNHMEQGLLPAEGVSDSVLSELGKILGQSAEALRQAGGAIAAEGGPGAGEATVFARTARADAPPDALAQAAPRAEAEGDWDEVDRLFRGG
jgi:hypothetical protein